MFEIDLGDRYKIKSEIGQGGMANVYMAVDEVLHREVAVKLLHDHLAQDRDLCHRFQQEASIAAKLEHPNIVKIYDYGQAADGRSYIISELIRGQNLHKLQLARMKARRGPFEPAICAMICEEVLKGLNCAHEQSYIHRDVKPDNVMISRNGYVKLTDFGIAKKISSTLTMAGQFLGSPSYSSPEQVKGHDLDFRSDIFSTGIIFYEALTGRLPYSGTSATDVMMKIAAGQVRPLVDVAPHLPMALQNVINRAIQHRKEDRFQKTTEMIDEIRCYLDTLGVANSRAGLEEYSLVPGEFLRAVRLRERELAQPPIEVTKIAPPKLFVVEEIGHSSEDRDTLPGSAAARHPIPKPPPLPPSLVKHSRPQHQQRSARPHSLHSQKRTLPKAYRKKAAAHQPQSFENELSRQRNTHRDQRIVVAVSSPSGGGFGRTAGLVLGFLGLFLLVFLFKINNNSSNQSAQLPISSVGQGQGPVSQPSPANAERPVSQPPPVIKPESAPLKTVIPKPMVQKPMHPARSPPQMPRPKIQVRETAVKRVPVLQNNTNTPEPPNDKPALSQLILRTVPKGLPVILNGIEKEPSRVSRSAAVFEIPPGRSKLVIRAAVVGNTKYQGTEMDVYVAAGETKDLGLIRLIPLRSIKLKIAGQGIVAKIDGDPYVLANGQLTVERPEGLIDLEIRSSNGRGLRRKIMLKGEDLLLDTSLE